VDRFFRRADRSPPTHTSIPAPSAPLSTTGTHVHATARTVIDPEFPSAAEQQAFQLVHQRKTELYLQLSAGNLQTFPGLHELLDQIKQRGLPVCVASSGSPTKIQWNLSQAGLAHRFSLLVSAEEVARGKPAPDLFLWAAQRCGQQFGLGRPLRPDRTLVVEDSINGLRAARAGGFVAVGLVGTFSRQQLLSEADIVLDSFTEFPWDWLDRLPDVHPAE
jgi:HAD superfamily hydrolase (TIGR01509 family)